MLTLTTDDIAVSIDPARGADVLSILDRGSGSEVLFSTPWRRRADAVSSGVVAPPADGTMSAWLAGYRGGWQVLCPNAGPERVADAAVRGYHGEASIVPWAVESSSETSARLSTELFTAPLELTRSVSVEGRGLTMIDRVRNASPVAVSFDYVQHPAFGGDLLDGSCSIVTGAQTFTPDPEVLPDALACSRGWPSLEFADGGIRDLSIAPEETLPAVFGWLSEFDEAFYEIRNDRTGLGVRLEWDGELLPYAWYWANLNSNPEWPWFRRARVVAIEPSSTITSGSARRETLTLEAGGELTFPFRFSLTKETTDD